MVAVGARKDHCAILYEHFWKQRSLFNNMNYKLFCEPGVVIYHWEHNWSP